MSLSRIKENSVNKDDNGIERFFGAQQEFFSVDLTGTGDRLTMIKDENDLWIVEDDTMLSHIHFTEAIDVTIQEYIEEMKEQGREDVVGELTSILDQVS